MKKIVLYLIVMCIVLVNPLYAQNFTNHISNGVATVNGTESMSAFPVEVYGSSSYIGFLFPNPARDRCNLLIQRDVDKLEVGLFSLSGFMFKRLSATNIHAGYIISLDLRDLREGIYSIQIRAREGTRESFEMHQLMVVN